METPGAPSTFPGHVIQMDEVTVPALDDPETPLIEAVNWSVASRDYWVIGARPGGGKSALLAVAAGLLRPIRGTYRLFGRDLTGLQGDEPLPERLRVALVFGNGGRLFNALTVRDNVALPLRYHHNHDPDEVHERVRAMVDLLGLTPFINSPAGRINRSWRQRVALARALILEPEALLLDNPLTGLDPRQSHWWLDLLTALAKGHAGSRRRPLTLVVATDDLRPWREHGNHFALITGNRWLVVGGRAELERCDQPLLRELFVDGASVD